ncbi:MAG TPA: carbamoyltransferase HypF [Polyangiaceae bacterium]|nr:carbamoyltransferase HypF [Polyangiaceae bacterium]
MTRWRAEFHGIVQGVGFRPRAYREARERALSGWVQNRGGRVELEVEGPSAAIEDFIETLRRSPAPARIEHIERMELAETHETGFHIVTSQSAEVEAALPADLAPCAECERELRDPANRRYRHPFTSCVACGPRYSIARGLPYDRELTTMASFPLCPTCRREYEDPSDRRYHAEPIACPECGPQLTLVTAGGTELATGTSALYEAVRRLREGEIIALRGLGGYQLLVDARSSSSVRRLRERKHREEKPLAVLFASLAEVRSACDISAGEAELLASPARPIVLVKRRSGAPIAPDVAPGLSELGVFLPPTPLLSLLLAALDFPIVCTSGNLSGEPLCIDNTEALVRLASVADAFLIHDRVIARPLDDSVVRLGARGLQSLRRARGYAPLPVARFETGEAVVALGGYQKSTIALAWNGRAILSQHLGDHDNAKSLELFERTLDDLLAFYGVRPEVIACDQHPDYPSSAWGEALSRRLGARLLRVQHHHAHAAAVLAEHGVDQRALALSWDGTGLGSDGTIWGGEALVVQGARFQRLGHLGTFPLLGGDQAAREPRRCALGLLFATAPERARDFAHEHFRGEAAQVLLAALERRVNAPLTSSLGRLFDAVASLLGIRQRCSYEGQAAMELEALARREHAAGGYALPFSAGALFVADLGALVEQVTADLARRESPARIAARFQNALVGYGVALAARAGLECVVLGGGCFQNQYLRDELARRLTELGHRVLTADTVPTNDGGLALGQAWVASQQSRD